jgi:hypothetical protein
MNMLGLQIWLWSFVEVIRECALDRLWRVGVCGKIDGRNIKEDVPLGHRL